MLAQPAIQPRNTPTPVKSYFSQAKTRIIRLLAFNKTLTFDGKHYRTEQGVKIDGRTNKTIDSLLTNGWLIVLANGKVCRNHVRAINDANTRFKRYQVFYQGHHVWYGNYETPHLEMQTDNDTEAAKWTAGLQQKIYDNRLDAKVWYEDTHFDPADGEALKDEFDFLVAA